MTGAQGVEARRLAVAAILAALDDRDADIPALLADADREMLVVVAGGMAIAMATIAQTVPSELQASIREQLAGYALAMATW